MGKGSYYIGIVIIAASTCFGTLGDIVFPSNQNTIVWAGSSNVISDGDLEGIWSVTGTLTVSGNLTVQSNLLTFGAGTAADVVMQWVSVGGTGTFHYDNANQWFEFNRDIEIFGRLTADDGIFAFEDSEINGNLDVTDNLNAPKVFATEGSGSFVINSPSGIVYGTAADTGTITVGTDSETQGAFAGGFADSGIIRALADGSIALGLADGDSTISSGGLGSFAQGYTAGEGLINSTGRGSFAQGNAFPGLINSTGDGSFAQGRAGTSNITASGSGSFAQGFAGSSGDIIASNTNAVQFGSGTNSTADSLQVGSGVLLKANGDITAVGTITGGSITDGTATLTGGNLTNIGTIGAATDDDLLTLSADQLTVAGDLTVGSTALDVDSTNLTVGIGIAADENVLLKVASVRNIDADFVAIRGAINLDTDTNPGLNFTALDFQIAIEGNQVVGTITGTKVDIGVNNFLGGTIDEITSFCADEITVNAGRGSITVNKIYGFTHLMPSLIGDDTNVTNAYGFFTGGFNANTVGIDIENAFGFYSTAHLADAGTLENAYGLYLEEQSVGNTTNWQIFSAGGNTHFGTGTHEFIGATNVTGTLDISGFTRADGWLGIGVNPSALNLINIESDIDGNIQTRIRNNHAGSSALAQYRIQSNAGSINLTAHSTAGGGTFELFSVGGPLSIFTNNADDLILGTNSLAAITIDGATSNVTIEDTLTVREAATFEETLFAQSDANLGNGPSDTITINGVTTIGDGGGTNYTQFSTTGSITQIGSAVAQFNDTTITGSITVKGGNELRFSDVGDSHYVGFEAPALTASQIWVLPDADGNANAVLTTDGAGNLDWTDPGLVFGEIYADDNAVTTDLAAQDTWYDVTVFTTNGESNGTTPDHTDDSITIDSAGVYLVIISFDARSAQANDYYFSAFKNKIAGTELHNIEKRRTTTTANRPGAISISGFVNLAATDTISLGIRRSDGGGTSKSILIEHVNMLVIKMEGVLSGGGGGGPKVIEAHTGDDTLTNAETGSVHTNRGAGGLVTLTLPASAIEGTEFTFCVQEAQQMRIDPGVATIRSISGQTPDKFKWADAIGETITLVADSNGDWVVVSMSGIWTEEA